MRLRVFPLGRPQGWLLLTVLVVGASTSFYAYHELNEATGVPTIPGPSTVSVLQRSGAEDATAPKVDISYVQETGSTNFTVCATNDVMLFIQTRNPMPDTATRYDREHPTTPLVPAKLNRLDKGKALVIPAPDVPGACIIHDLDDEWLSTSMGAKTALRAPSIQTCWSMGGRRSFDMGTLGRWVSRSVQDCTSNHMRLEVSSTGIVASAPESEPEPDPTVTYPSKLYAAESRIQVDDTARANEIAHSQTWLGVVLGVGLTFFAEGLLGFAASVTDPEERRRTWRRRRLWDE